MKLFFLFFSCMCFVSSLNVKDEIMPYFLFVGSVCFGFIAA